MTNKEAIKRTDEQLLAELGYKQEFKRVFTPLEVFGIAFSIIGLLPSIASVLAYSLPNGGPSAMVWGWAVASFFIFCIGLSMAELASAAPTAGGGVIQLYFWTHSLSSPRYRNLLSWVVGSSLPFPSDANTIGNIAGVASVDWACAVQIAAAINIGNQQFVATQTQTFGIYVAVVFSHGIICSLGTDILARLQNLYIILNFCLCFVVLIGLPIATPKEYMNSASFALGNFTNVSGWPNGFAFIMSFLAPLWTINGFDSSVHISEEATNAATAVPWAIVSAVSIASLLGWAINISLTFCMGTDLTSLISSPQPMAQIFLNSFGQTGTLVIWSFVVLAQYMMGSSLVLATSRQTFAFARDGALPLSSILYRMNRFTCTPVNTVWFVAAIVALLGLLSFAGAQAINAIFALSVTGLYIAYSIPIASRPETKANVVQSLPVAVIAVSFMAFMNIVFFFPATPQTSASNMNYTVVVLGGVLVLSLVWYYFPVYGGVHWFTGPVPNVGKEDATEYDSKSSSKVVDEKVEAVIMETDI
ncbi:amino acid/polyamine transporter I [Boletus edulis BED1]|uniref:Amino acid/polyamine transporter I n=1 Tax=Boletus edulis BED1 TaxID=1328754 RepID=A0AAD4GDN1_BOLED|nr:amino acid/polyamine transporter I [Boletus edulis BED1]